MRMLRIEFDYSKAINLLYILATVSYAFPLLPI